MNNEKNTWLLMVLCFVLCVYAAIFFRFFVNLTETKYGIEPHEFLKNAETRNFYK